MSHNSAYTVAPARFGFGKNWLSFVNIVDEARIMAARDSLLEALHLPTLSGLTFLDVGCGSGLFSLAACQLGAHVRSFDYDQDSVQATIEIRRRFAADSDWLIEQGSILNPEFMSTMGRFDIVYAWGVLHHTGDLWRAIDATTRTVAPSGLLYMSIYNDQGLSSRMWRDVKRRYNSSGEITRAMLVAGSAIYLRRHQPLRSLRRAVRRQGDAAVPRPRGMSRRHDLVDWVGGYPFEVAKPDEVFTFAHRLGFDLRHLRTAGGGLGCNEFVFQARP
jgi:2-polyprenyl-3-methyl-5-hydroxy-6-metoxy-1,4-benzoquinol methylase